jgi:cell division protease FtsH
MFVGVGASRVRDLFVQAKERAPCIIFIDELDAVGKSRGGGPSLVGNDERDQTLNQLLVEMDGFDSEHGIVIMAATNRPEVLDRALLRPGRFDRDVLVDRPDVRGREAILQVHARRLKLGGDVDLRLIAQRTPGMVGADLANVVNEAALASVRRGGDYVTSPDFEEATDRMQLGLKKHGRAMTEDEKRRVAYHESGHALVALTMRHADPVHRVTIIPRTIGALGVTLQLPDDDKHLATVEELKDKICVLLGGRVAEELACDDVSTGAENDFERATDVARQMVCRWGMSELGPITFARGGPRFLAVPELGSRDERECSEATSRAIDAQIAAIVARELSRARSVLGERRATLESLAKELLAKETLERPELLALAAEGREAKVASAAATALPPLHPPSPNPTYSPSR